MITRISYNRHPTRLANWICMQANLFHLISAFIDFLACFFNTFQLIIMKWFAVSTKIWKLIIIISERCLVHFSIIARNNLSLMNPCRPILDLFLLTIYVCWVEVRNSLGIRLSWNLHAFVREKFLLLIKLLFIIVQHVISIKVKP